MPATVPPLAVAPPPPKAVAKTIMPSVEVLNWPRVMVMMSSNDCSEPMMASSVLTVTEDQIRGSVIFQKTCHSLAPSM